MEPFFVWYLTGWLSACLVAVGIFLRQPQSFVFARLEYLRFLFVPWKLITFGSATAGITLIAPYSGDPTWDYFDALFMSLLTFLSAPWAIGTVYLVGRGQRPLKHLYVALCMWMFSASWSYDLYLVFRDGFYPATWLTNMVASSVLYIAAGLLWNLDFRPNRGVTFSFLERDWPCARPSAAFGRLFWVALPLMLLAAAAILYFLVPN